MARKTKTKAVAETPAAERRVINFGGGAAEELGMNVTLFNTFRMGWSDYRDLKPGERVTARVLESGEEFPLFVLRVDIGELGDMLALHSGLNHRAKNRMPADRRAELLRILEGDYDRRMRDSDTCCVIHFGRLIDPV